MTFHGRFQPSQRLSAKQSVKQSAIAIISDSADYRPIL